MSVHDKYLVQVCFNVYLQGTDIMSVQVWLYNYIYILSEYWRKCLQVRLDVYCSLLTCTGCTSPCCRTSTTTCMAASRTWVWEWKKESSTCFRYTCIMVLAILKTDRHSGSTQTRRNQHHTQNSQKQQCSKIYINFLNTLLQWHILSFQNITNSVIHVHVFLLKIIFRIKARCLFSRMNIYNVLYIMRSRKYPHPDCISPISFRSSSFACFLPRNKVCSML